MNSKHININFFFPLFQTAGEKAIDFSDLWKPRAQKSGGGTLTAIPPSQAAISSFKRWRKRHTAETGSGTKLSSNEEEMNFLKFLALVSSRIVFLSV